MIRSLMNTVSLNIGTAVTLVQPNPNRVALLFSPPDVGTYMVSLNGNISDLLGIRINAGGNPLLLTRDQFGDGLDRAWYALPVDAGPGLTPNRVVAMESFQM